MPLKAERWQVFMAGPRVWVKARREGKRPKVFLKLTPPEARALANRLLFVAALLPDNAPAPEPCEAPKVAALIEMADAVGREP